MLSAIAAENNRMAAAEYLAMERNSGESHQLVDGQLQLKQSPATVKLTDLYSRVEFLSADAEIAIATAASAP